MSQAGTLTAAANAEEMVPNFWLRNLRANPLISQEAFNEAFAKAGLDGKVLEVAGQTLPFHREIAVLEALAEQSDDPLYAVKIGQATEGNIGSVLSYLLFSSPTLRVGLAHVSEFIRLTRPNARMQLIAGPDTVELRIEHPDIRVQKAARYREFVLASLLKSLSEAAQTQVIAKELHIATPVGSLLRPLERAFRCPIRESMGYTAILLSPAVADLKVRTSDEHLLLHLTDYGRVLMRDVRPGPTSMREGVFKYLIRSFPGVAPRLAEVAQALAVSERSLSRRLAEEGTSFRSLLDENRKIMADALLDDPTMSLAEISYLLGFSDQSSFSHAYRRWNGLAPTHARLTRRVSA